MDSQNHTPRTQKLFEWTQRKDAFYLKHEWYLPTRSWMKQVTAERLVGMAHARPVLQAHKQVDFSGTTNQTTSQKSDTV